MKRWVLIGLLGAPLGATACAGYGDGESADAKTQSVIVESDTCRVDYTVDRWDSGFRANVEVTNKGPDVSDWEVGFRVADGDQIGNLWRGEFAQNGNQVVVANPRWGGDVPSDGVFDFGFTGVGPGELSGFTFNGISCENGAVPPDSGNNDEDTPQPDPQPDPDPGTGDEPSAPQPDPGTGDSTTAQLVSPRVGDTFTLGEEISFTTSVPNPNEIKVIRFRINDGSSTQVLSVDRNAPFEHVSPDLPPGNYRAWMTVVEQSGAKYNSPEVTFAVSDEYDDGGADGGSGGTPGEKILLPVEVLGSPGTTVSRTFQLDNTSGVSHLYLQCFNCGYNNHEKDMDRGLVKAQVQVNDCNPIDLKAYSGHEGEKARNKSPFYGNPDVSIIGPEAKAGGIGGAFRTVRMSVELDNRCLSRGQNTLSFIYKDYQPGSRGFRIVDMNLLRGGTLSNRVLPESDFVDDDPTLWSPIHGSRQDIAEGKRLWERRNSLYDHVADMRDGRDNGAGPEDGMIRAACSDCHAPSGRDLKYFNFSDYSIVAVSKDHQLSQREGELIASYIRSLDIPVAPGARPWNPPYQPGPGLDARPVHEWAAGAGIDAVLDEDEDTLDYLFPEGTSQAQVDKVVDRYGTLNMRELPVAIQMPHWGAWLPEVSPIDAFDRNHPAVLSDDKGRATSLPYFEEIYERAKNNPTRGNLANMFFRISRWWGKGSNCATQAVSSGPNWRRINGDVVDAVLLPHPNITASNCRQLRHDRQEMRNIELVKRGLASWAATRLWDIIHENELEEESQKQTKRYCTLGRCVTGAEPRGWVVATESDRFDVFHLAPHYLGFNADEFSEKSRSIGIYEMNQWYHLQMLVNPGYKEAQTSHWAYTLVYMMKLALNEDDSHHAARYYASIIKYRQLQTNGLFGDTPGLSLRVAQPFWYFSGENGERLGHQDLPNNLYTKLYESLSWDLIEAAREGTRNDWSSAGANDEVQPRNSTNFSLRDLGNGVFPTPGPFQGRNTKRLIDITSRGGSGMNPRPSLELQLEMCDWGEEMWPNGGWDALRDTVRSRY